MKNKDITVTDDNQSGQKRKIKIYYWRTLIIAVVLLVILTLVKTPFMLQAPGSCDDVAKYVRVKNGKNINTHGRFFLSTVIYERANLLFFIWGKIDKSTELIPVKKINYDTDEKKVNIFMQNQMEMSKLKAKIAAYRALGFHVPLKKSTQVKAIMKWSLAKEVLKVGDRILAVNGTTIQNDKELMEKIQEAPPGSRSKLTIMRDKKQLEVETALTEHMGKRKIGIIVMTTIEDARMPGNVEIESKNIVGASAGLMFSLEIMRQVSGVDLTGGYLVSGTGVIDEDGIVYPIEGARFKVIAARNRGVQVFLVPEKNFNEAKEAAKNIKLFPVKNLQDALDILKKLNPSATIETGAKE